MKSRDALSIKFLSFLLLAPAIFLLSNYFSTVIAIQEGYRGVSYTDFGFMFKWGSIFLTILIFFLIPIKNIRPSDLSINIFFILFVIPTLFFGAHNTPDIFISLKLISLTVLAFVTYCIFLKIPMPFFRVPIFQLSPVRILIGILMFLLLASSIAAFFNGVSAISDLSAFDLYESRLSARDSGGTFMAYTLSAARSILLIWLLYYFFDDKSSFLIRLIAATSILFVLFSQFLTLFIRSQFYISFFICVFCIFFNKGRANFLNICIFFLILVVGLMLVDFIIFRDDLISYTILRRLFITPGLINTFYVDYYQNYGPYFWRLEELELTFLVGGYTHINHFESNMNSNIWFQSYGYFGIPGIIMTSLISAFLIRIFDNFHTDNKLFAFISVLFISLIWMESSIWTSMLTNGIFYILSYHILMNYLTLEKQ